jgi:hypothetical protein
MKTPGTLTNCDTIRDRTEVIAQIVVVLAFYWISWIGIRSWGEDHLTNQYVRTYYTTHATFAS